MGIPYTDNVGQTQNEDKQTESSTLTHTLQLGMNSGAREG